MPPIPPPAEYRPHDRVLPLLSGIWGRTKAGHWEVLT